MYITKCVLTDAKIDAGAKNFRDVSERTHNIKPAL